MLTPKARKKLKHTAFQALNEEVLKTFEEQASLNLYKGYRLWGVDGSKVNLPDHPEISHHFGKVLNTNQTKMVRYYSGGLLQICYDVLNRVTICSDLVSSQVYEPSAFMSMMDHCHAPSSVNSIMLFDRHYASYEMIRYLESRDQSYVIRIPRSSFKQTQSMFKSDLIKDQIVFIGDFRVRLLRIELYNGEIEVLATNILDELSGADFAEIYHHRWGVETYFHLVKDRLSLENFTGKTLESVMQDFWSTILICNIEASCTHDLKSGTKRKRETKAGQYKYFFSCFKAQGI